MCQICEDWESGQLSSKGAFKAIGDAMKTAKTKKQMDHFHAVCDKILSKECPEPEVNEEEDERFWNSTHPKDDENG